MTSEDATTYDVVVVGSGAGGLVGAYLAASRGLRTLLIEKTDQVGGTTAYSGAGIWYPGSAPITRAGADDDVEAGRTYLRAAVADDSRADLQDAYLRAGIAVIDELERNPWFQSFEFQPVPDYYSALPGASPTGRTIFPPALAVAKLGKEAALVRRPIYTEQRGIDEGPVWVGGRSLIGRALKAFLETGNGEVRTGTALKSLVVEEGRVVGLVAAVEDGDVTLRATRGVLLAAGGFERNAELRARYQSSDLTGAWSNGAPGNTGDALLAGVAVGADTELLDEAWFIPGVLQPYGKPLFHTGTRGGVWVNGEGRRFCNETAPYDQSGHAIYRAHTTTATSHLPISWVFDQRHLDTFNIGGPPGEPTAPEWFASGALRKAETLEGVAELIGVPHANLKATVEEYNHFSDTGVDEKFHRGESTWDRTMSYIVGYPAGPPASLNYLAMPDESLKNPLLPPLDSPPYYVATVLLSDIGTKGGLKTDVDARVLGTDGRAIPGLYATGNTMAAMSGHVYPGAGTPIGSSVAFAYQAVLDLAGN
ncbi:FAD-binding protein [Kineosporia mesophila]|uniref:FAD-binding protein n=1 Tax=Kineosporia mesophila TaxID=566012 RepID=A0ABP6ZLD8_9ACTN|nr:FAD-dependent oxidoreductase [Kineosporia mesophila]